jgi:hypothetical protein
MFTGPKVLAGSNNIHGPDIKFRTHDFELMDTVAWRLTPSGIFFLSSAYRALFRGPSLPWTTPLWKTPLPLKTKIFVWQMLGDRLPSGVVVSKRQGPGDGLCPLCGIPESGTNIMFTCPASWFLWSFVQGAGPKILASS